MEIEPSEPGGLGEVVAEVESLEPEIRWGISLRSGDETEVHGGAADEPLAIASVGKVLLLITLAGLIDTGELDPDGVESRRPEDAVADTGLWRHLGTPALSIGDLAVLVGSVSDNLATSVLLRRVGLDAIDGTRRSLGLEATRVLDRVRDERGPADPPAFAVGSARELSYLFARLRAAGDPLGEEVASRVIGWLRLNADLSMVASAFHLDPLARVTPDIGIDLVDKTGADTTVRADAGYVAGPSGSVAYAAIANWDEHADLHEPALAGMHRLGAAIRDHVG